MCSRPAMPLMLVYLVLRFRLELKTLLHNLLNQSSYQAPFITAKIVWSIPKVFITVMLTCFISYTLPHTDGRVQSIMHHSNISFICSLSNSKEYSLARMDTVSNLDSRHHQLKWILSTAVKFLIIMHSFRFSVIIGECH